MQQKVIEHKLRKIEFEFDEAKPWTKADEMLVSAFVEVHDWHLQRSELGSFLWKHCIEQNKKVDAAREVLEKVKQTFANTRLLADALLAFNTLKREAVIAHFYQEVDKSSKELMEYDAIMRAIDMKELEKEKTKYFEDQNHRETWDKLSDADLAHSKTWKENSIDVVSFGKADDSFRSFISFSSQRADTYMDSINRTIANHARLMLETEMQYEIWKEFQKRIQLFEHFTGRNKPGGDYFNAN